MNRATRDPYAGSAEDLRERLRALTEEVQRWSYRYGLIFYALPFGGLFGEQIRVGIMSMIGRVKFTVRKLSWLRHGGHSIA